MSRKKEEWCACLFCPHKCKQRSAPATANCGGIKPSRAGQVGEVNVIAADQVALWNAEPLQHKGDLRQCKEAQRPATEQQSSKQQCAGQAR